MRVLCIAAALLVTVVGCGGGGSAADASTKSPADRAVAAAVTANAIVANPAATDSILTARGYTRDGFQKLMYEVAADSAMSRAYTDARTR